MIAEFVDTVFVFLADLSEFHNINPVVFGVLYVGTIPLYLASIGWIIKNQRAGKAILLPAISTIFFFFLPAFYVAFFGRNVAWYIYVIMAILIIYGSFSLFQKIQSKKEEVASEA